MAQRRPQHAPEMEKILQDKWRRTEADFRVQLETLGLSTEQVVACLRLGTRLYWRGAVDVVASASEEPPTESNLVH